MNSKFRGTLLGVLVGDCCGAIFEGESFDAGQKLVLRNFLKKLEDPKYVSSPRIKYTDDTAMTKSVGKCLLRYDAATYQKELAINFVKEYFISPNRGYGSGVQELFHQLKKENFKDVLEPAGYQFGRRGSYGNGAAMRISPVALYCIDKSEDFLIDLVKKTSVITHSNVIGENGAILQALAIHKNLKLEPNIGFDIKNYVDELLEKFKKIETGQDENGIPEETHYTKQLKAMKNLLNKNFLPSDEEVINTLGHSVNALYSVPTAIYCFLRNIKPPDSDVNAIKQTLEFTVSLGGDTDTIASMACALSGALYGDGLIAETLAKHCEASEEITQLADQLYEVVTKSSVSK